MRSKERFEKYWEELDKRLSEETYTQLARLQPLVSAAKIHPYLQTLFPYKSLYYLRFGTSETYTFNDLGYEVVALPEGTLCTVLQIIYDDPTLHDESEPIIEDTFRHYDFLRHREQPYFQFDTEGKITEVIDIRAGIGWILEQLDGWYRIGKGRNEFDKETSVFANLDDTITYLAKVLKERAESDDIEEEV